jgi:hypothetical protein
MYSGGDCNHVYLLVGIRIDGRHTASTLLLSRFNKGTFQLLIHFLLDVIEWVWWNAMYLSLQTQRTRVRERYSLQYAGSSLTSSRQ